MKICITRWPFSSQFGGEEQHTLQVVSWLKKKGFEFIYMGNCKVLRKKLGIPVYRFWNHRPPVSIRSLLVFTFLSPLLLLRFFLMAVFLKVKKIKAVYMMSFGEKLLFTPWCRLFGMKVYWAEHARVGNWLTKNPWFPWYKLMSGLVTTIVTSESMLKFFPWAKKKVAITCGVDKAEFPLEKGKIEDLISQKLPEKAFLVGMVNRLTKDKGVFELIEAAKQVPDIQFLMIGEGEEKKSLKKDLPENFLLLGKRSRKEVLKFMKLIDVFVLASTEEDPFGMVVAEAMISGTPTVVTTACGVSEYLTNQKDAILIKPKSGSEIADAVSRLYKDEDLYRRLSSRGKETAEKEFSLDRMIEEFKGLLS